MIAAPVAFIGSWYHDGIVATGREFEFLFLAAFLVSFGFIRTSAHLIRAQVSWWPGNVNVGGTHVHHLVWGILLLLVAGYVGVVVAPAPPGHQIATVAFGVGAGLTLDEFALWLNLRDVYWAEEGRRSIDAVIVAAALAALAVLGFRIWLDVGHGVEDAAFAAVGIFGGFAIAVALVNVAKYRLGFAAVSLLLPVVGLAGALRLARPGSLWARFYRPPKLERARRRYGERRAVQSATR